MQQTFHQLCVGSFFTFVIHAYVWGDMILSNFLLLGYLEVSKPSCKRRKKKSLKDLIWNFHLADFSNVV